MTVSVPEVALPPISHKEVAIEVPEVSLPPVQHKEVAVEVPVVALPPIESKNINVEVPEVALPPAEIKAEKSAKLLGLLEQLHAAHVNKTLAVAQSAKGLFPASKKEVYALEKEITELQKEIEMLTPVRGQRCACG